ncbi:unnamed protein product, partial [Mesorhabditis belari]|uniref:G-protein coupled receptors family 1 profile domain-containing protein n=1 Tax=Mesorhabditis belari TaxID=2138241 RepID=A0AAF3F3C0_9BILA
MSFLSGILASTLPTATPPPVAVVSLLDGGEPMAGVEYIAHVVVMPIVLTIGMVNQCLNIFTLLHLPSTAFLYLKASAVADILSILSFIPFLIRHAGLHNQYSHLAMYYHAHLELPIINALIAASALCIVAMTIDRYLSVCHPITFFNSSDSKKRTLAVIAGLYLTAFIVFFPSIWQKDLKEKREDYTNRLYWVLERNSVIERSPTFQFYLYFREFVSRWGPILILVVLNAAMIRKLRKLDKKTLRRSIRQRSCNLGRSPREDRSRISVLLLVTATTFVICNLPASFLSMFISNSIIKIEIDPKTVFWQSFRALSNLLQTTSYLYNFYLYALCSSEYREAFRKLIGCQQDRLMKIFAFLKSTSSCATQTTDDSPPKKGSGNIPLVSKKNGCPPELKIFNENEEMLTAVAM